MATTTRVIDANVSGTVYTNDLNNALEALDTSHAGSSAPTDELSNGKLWLDTSATPATLKVYNNSVWEPIGGGILYEEKSTTHLAIAGEGVVANTSSGAWTLTLPASPVSGDVVVIVDGADFSVNNLTVARNGSTIAGLSEDLVLDIGNVSVHLVYAFSDWQVFAQVGAAGANSSIDDNGNATAITIDSSERVMIGTTTAGVSGAEQLTVGSSGNTGVTIRAGSSSSSSIYMSDATSGVGESTGYIEYAHGSDAMTFATVGTEAMRIDSSGNVGIGTSSPSQPLHVSTATNPAVHITNTDGTNGSTLRMAMTTNGAFIGTQNPLGGSDALRFGTGNEQERMRIDSSGNLLVGTTTSIPAASSQNTTGIAMQSDGQLHVSSDGQFAGAFNRKTSDGAIVEFRKNGTTVGSIAACGNAGIIVGTTDVALRFRNQAGGASIFPRHPNDTGLDNVVDLGLVNARFDDIYATNGTIQTSDRNEKQDIASLTPTEMLVAARLSTGFKNFRWKDSVAEKGAAARMHSGAIAQDVQDAFTAEGLDAGDYSMFISATWWAHDVDVPAVEAVAEVVDEEGVVVTEAVEAVAAYTRTDTYDTEAEAPVGAVSKTRLGVRYPELLSFVAAYNEQRFASIEARLTTLEGA